MTDQPSPPCFDCAADPIGRLREMFVDLVQRQRIDLGQDPAARPVFTKLHGVASARWEPLPGLPPELAVGVFGMGPRQAWVRFSSDAQPADPDLRSTCGVAIKLFDVTGPKLLGDGTTQDFLLQDHDVFFVDTVVDMCEFTEAGVVGGDYRPYLDTHPTTKRILDEMRTVVSSVLSTTYWSGLPYALGDRFVKYKLVPRASIAGPPPDDANYLATDLATRLRADEYRFDFMVQLRTDAEAMPLDRATVRWDEAVSPPIHVATLVLPRQDVGARGQAAYGENLAFNPWHSLAEHSPQGSIAEARRVVYAASADQRRTANGVGLQEPGPARQPSSGSEIGDDRCIVRAAIHPTIGIARVGNSDEEFVIGPEVVRPEPLEPGSYRDTVGALKRQAARFRVYGLNASGAPVRELTGDADADVTWEVHLANGKAAWYEFQIALDIPEADSASATNLRNPTVSDRSALVIDPGPRSVSGADRSGPDLRFDSGSFMGTPVYLGELRTDEAGRLMVLGGRGVSSSFDDSRAFTFANNDGWHDDVSDGPVRATVRYQGVELPVDPAWVLVAPPNYAPLQKSVRTMWDLMRDVAITAGKLAAPMRPSFEDDLRPIFERLSDLQWVNAGFAAAFGWEGPFDLASPRWLARLSDPTSTNRETRLVIANSFRDFAVDAWSPKPWPWLYGDAMNNPPAETPRQHASLTDTQLRFLDQWAEGDFEADYDPSRTWSPPIDEVPIEDQPAMLDRASLEFCLADAFHPGCEMTWPVRHWSMYAAPWRLAHAKPDAVEPSYGAAIDSSIVTAPVGPLGPQRPGGLTRWMAVPWQTDTASCRSGYDSTYDTYVPTFWPARVPNEVLSAEHYDIVMDTDRPLADRMAAFTNRAPWLRGLDLTATYAEQINRMIARFGELGVVEQRPGPGDDAFPATMQVEDEVRRLRRETADARPAAAGSGADLAHTDKARRFPHGLRRRP
jgi:hypothetical protein